MLRIQRFINQLMSSNCYVIWDDQSKRCVVIDPGSEESLREIEFLTVNELILDYIILTHEHTDHNWGVNSLKKIFSNSTTICHADCASEISIPKKSYFNLYYNRTSYTYRVSNVDTVCREGITKINWDNRIINIIHTPGHCKGAVCIVIEDILFSGDTILQSKPYIDKRTGTKEQYQMSIRKILDQYKGKNMKVYPGHGDMFLLEQYMQPSI